MASVAFGNLIVANPDCVEIRIDQIRGA